MKKYVSLYIVLFMLFACSSEDSNSEDILQRAGFEKESFKEIFVDGYWMEKACYVKAGDDSIQWLFAVDIKGVKSDNPFHTLSRFHIDNDSELTEYKTDYIYEKNKFLCFPTRMKYYLSESGEFIVDSPHGIMKYQIDRFVKDTIILQGNSWYYYWSEYIPSKDNNSRCILVRTNRKAVIDAELYESE